MHSKNILIVDDEPRTRKGLLKTLENWGKGNYQVEAVSGPEEAIKIINENKIHLLITDIRMPEMNGLQMIESLKSKMKNPVVIVISAYSEFKYAQQSIRLGVNNYLLKPIDKNKLIEAVEQALHVEQQQERSGIMEKVIDVKIIDINSESKYAPPIKESLEYIDKNYAEELTLKTVADHVHLNASYFSSLFKEQIYVTFSEYLTRVRLQQAKNLLISTNFPVGDIAEKVGYSTSKYFIKLFKQYEGMTPSAFRKTNVSDF